MFKSIVALAIVGSLSLVSCATPATCFQCVNAKKIWDPAVTPNCVTTAPKTTYYDTRDLCAKNNVWAAGAITKTIDANFDLTKATVNTIELDLTKTDKEVSVVFI